ncbi:MAG: ester cyclase [bacterium]|nr:ester cyclase [bacterium]
MTSILDVTALRAVREALVREHIYCESHQDVDGAVATFARASYDVVPLANAPDAPHTHPTAADVHEHLSGLLNAFPDLELIIVTLHHADEAVIVEGRMKGTHSQDWGDLKATGRRMDMRAAIFYRFEGDQMVNETAYFDMATMLRQLGVMT